MASIDYLELPSGALAESQAFFLNVFGWKTIDYGPEYKGLDGAGIDLGVDGSAGAPAAPLPVIRVDDLDDAEQRVRAAGGTVTRAQFDFPGGRRFHFREPGGAELAAWVAGD